MTQTPTLVQYLSPFSSALHLHPTHRSCTQLHARGQPVATIKAVHTGANASKAPADDAGGVEAVVCLAKSARVMHTSNLWVDVGLVNGAMGTIHMPSVIRMEDRLIYQHLYWLTLTTTLALLFTMALFLSHPFAVVGLHRETTAHVCSSLSNWHGL